MIVELSKISEWTVNFLKYKDTITRKIESIDSSGNNLIVKLKSGGTHKYLCVDTLEGSVLEPELRLSCLNNRKNLDWVLTHWDNLVENKCSLLFANPEKSQSWAVHPAMHSSVTEKAALKPGLLSLFESVPETY